MHPAIPSARFAIAGFGELIADASRVAMLLSLLDGLARPASELAQIAGVTPSTASAHLQRLIAGGLLRVERQGRHRYFQLADERIAESLENLARQAPRPSAALRPDPTREMLSHARTCYRHLAGRLGVAWYGALEREGILRSRRGVPQLIRGGIRRLADLGLSLPDEATGVEGKACLDWTERSHHLGGALGSLLTDRMLALRWIARRKDTRAVRVTQAGCTGLAEIGISADVLEGAR